MNEDTQLQTYKEKWESVKLSDSSRARMADSLRSYAEFHPVRAAEGSRSIEQVPTSTFLQRFKLTTMPIAIFLAVCVTAGTSFAAQGAVPGDYLYPIKTEVNENVRSAFTFGADAEAELQADLLEERLEEAQTLHANGKLNGDTAVRVSSNLSSQAKAATDAAAKSEASIGAKTNTRVKAGLENFLAIVGLDTAIVSEINATFKASTLSTGTYAIEAYEADMKARITTLRDVLKKHQVDVEAKVHAELSAKLDAAALLVAEAEAQAEADARASLDKAATLVGEVEAKLSTLGQAQVDTNTGIITDIDFSIDPMKIDVGAGATGSAEASTTSQKPKPTKPKDTSNDVNIDIHLDGGVGVEEIDDTVDAALDSALEVTSGLGL